MRILSPRVAFAIIALLCSTDLALAAPESEPEMVLQIGHAGEVNGVAFSNGEKFLASAGESGEVQIREIATGDLWRSLHVPHGAARGVALSDDGKNVAATFPGGVAVWDMASGALLWQIYEEIHETLTLAFTPDSRRLAVGGRERKNFTGEIRFFNPTDGKLLAAWKTGNYAEAYRLAFSPDGSQLAVGDDRDQISIREAHRGKITKTLKGHFGRIEALAWSPDGTTLLSGSGDETAHLWNVSTGKLLRTWTAHLGGVGAVAFSPTGDEAFTLSSYGVRVWNVADGRALRSFRDLAAPSMALSPDGKTLALALPTADQDVPGQVGIFNSSDGKTVRIWSGYRDEINSVSFQNTSAGTFLLTGHGVVTGEDDASAGLYLVDKKGRPWQPPAFGVARVWNPRNGSLKSSLRDEDGKIGEAFLSHDGQRLLTCRYDAPVWWDAVKGKPLKTMPGHTHAIYAFAVSRDGANLATGGFDEKVRVWNLKTNRAWRSLPAKGSAIGACTALAWSGDGKVLFAAYAQDNDNGDATGTLYAWEVQTGNVVWRASTRGDEIWQAQVSPDDKFLATADSGGELKKREALTGKLIWRVRAHYIEDEREIPALVWSGDGSMLATGGEDTLVKTWDARNGRLLRTFAGHRALVNSVAFSSDGKTLLSSSDDGTIRFWNARSGAWRGSLRTLPGKGTSSWIAWTSDGYYDGSSDVEAFVRWNDGGKLLPASALAKRRPGLLAELITSP